MADSGEQNPTEGSVQKPGQRETLRIPALPPRPLRPATAKLAPRPGVTAGAATTLPLSSGKGFVPVPANAPGWSTAVTKPLSMGDPSSVDPAPRPASAALTPPIAPARPVASALPPAPARPVTRPASPALSGATPSSKTTPIRTNESFAELHASNPANVAAPKKEFGNGASAKQDAGSEAESSAARVVPRVIVAPPQAKVFLNAGDLALPAELATIDFASQAPAKLDTQALPVATGQRAHVRLDVSVPLADPTAPDALDPQPSLTLAPAPDPVTPAEMPAEPAGPVKPAETVETAEAKAEPPPEAVVPASMSPSQTPSTPLAPSSRPASFTSPRGPVPTLTALPAPNSSFAQTLPISRPVRSAATPPATGLPSRPNAATRAFATDRLPEVSVENNGDKAIPPIAPHLTPSDPQLSSLSRPVMPLNVVATGPFPSPGSITASPPAASAPVAPPPPKVALATPPPPTRVPTPPLADSSEDRTQVLPLPPRSYLDSAGSRSPIAPPPPENRATELAPLVAPPDPSAVAPALELKPSPTTPPARPLAIVPGKVVAPPRRTQTGPITPPVVSRPGAITARLDLPPPVPTPIRSDAAADTPTSALPSPAIPNAIAAGSVKPAPLTAVPVPMPLAKPIAAARPATPALPQPVAPAAAAGTPPKPVLPIAPSMAVGGTPKPVLPVAPNSPSVGTPPKPVLPIAPSTSVAGTPPKPVLPVTSTATAPAILKPGMPPPPPGVARPLAAVKPITGVAPPSAPLNAAEAPANGGTPLAPANTARSIPPKETARITIKPNRPGGTARLAGAVKPLISTLPPGGKPTVSSSRTPAAEPVTESKNKPSSAFPGSANPATKAPAPTTVPVNAFEYEKSTRVSTIAAGVLALLTWSVASYLGYVAFLS